MDLIASSDPVSEARIRVVMLPVGRSHANDIKPTPGTKSVLHEDVILINSFRELRLVMVRRQEWPPIYLYLLCVQLHSRYHDPTQEGLPAEFTHLAIGTSSHICPSWTPIGWDQGEQII